jgi:hydrogenase expression/formation protein HypE
MERIQLAHGSGGLMMQRLIRDVILRDLGDQADAGLDDAATLNLNSTRIAFTTDSFVVKPLFFPGGDIGSLAVSGTVNDLLMKGAAPEYLSLSFILEEGLPLSDFERIVGSIATTCRQAKSRIVTGDTKVVGAGEADGMFINTTGVGCIVPGTDISGINAKNGDAVIVSGSIGRHGLAVMAQRNGLQLSGDIDSDAAPLTSVVMPLLARFGENIHVLRDPTRGGVATTLGEISAASQVEIVLEENNLPVDEPVRAVSDLLGFDPLYLPCEGRFLAIIADEISIDFLAMLKNELACPAAEKIGTVKKSPHEGVSLTTLTGGRRTLDMPVGELLPRIC